MLPKDPKYLKLNGRAFNHQNFLFTYAILINKFHLNGNQTPSYMIKKKKKTRIKKFQLATQKRDKIKPHQNPKRGRIRSVAAEETAAMARKPKKAQPLDGRLLLKP